ncbi:GNAT family N-acetyltransferase [Sellimonas sp.]|uniref:GNAT family N-acetyltransferase n=1 Tax=Sellimonas sp. TaxID=2021466 RepID=UPI00257E89CE|nr:GNAT family protein [Sellimonas sp.]
MQQYDVKISPLTEREIKQKVLWYNDPEIRKYLHYTDLFNVKDSIIWLERIKKSDTRKEFVIWLIDGHKEIPVGIIGLFEIDRDNQKAGFYITIGEKQYQGKGIAKKATILFLKEMFEKFKFHKIYLYTDVENTAARGLYEKVGFVLEGILRDELFYQNHYVSRCYYSILFEEFMEKWG